MVVSIKNQNDVQISCQNHIFSMSRIFVCLSSSQCFRKLPSFSVLTKHRFLRSIVSNVANKQTSKQKLKNIKLSLSTFNFSIPFHLWLSVSSFYESHWLAFNLWLEYILRVIFKARHCKVQLPLKINGDLLTVCRLEVPRTEFLFYIF